MTTAIDVTTEPVGSADSVAFLRAVATREPDAAIRNPDYLAPRFVGGHFQRLLSLPLPLVKLVMRLRHPGLYYHHTGRTKFFDEQMSRALAAGATQVVILGAGHDTRAYRLRDKLQGVRVFEVDAPGTQRGKLQKVHACFGNAPANVSYVAVDFEANELRARLLDAGFTQQAVTFFLWEGVSYFLREGAVRRVLELVAESSLGSGVCFDYALRRFVEGDTSFYGAAAVRRWSEQANEPLRFGLDAGELAPLVRAYGMRVELDLDGPGLERAYLLRKNGKVAGRVLEPYRYAHVINDAGRAGC